MIADLPTDLVDFLREGRQLEYDADNSDIGRITLKSDSDLATSTITTFPGCQSIIADPYADLEGQYHIQVCDLVAHSEDYDTEGLLCWIVSVRQFGCVDPEHGDVFTFPHTTWTELADNPAKYLDAQWGDDDNAVRLLPWIHFPFRMTHNDIVLSPYASTCIVHDSPVTKRRTSRPPLFSVIRARNIEEWLQDCIRAFPCSGVPMDNETLLCCEHCRDAENKWFQDKGNAIVPVDAKPNAHGWVRCPGCGVRFMLTDSGVFKGGVHLECGQIVNIVN